MRKEIAGIPGLSLLILALVVISAYRFWLIGWPAWSGNLRLAAICAGGLGITALITGSLWTFGIRNRKRALLVTALATIGFLILNNI